jgi:4-amino-4-deoxy-L-arabinose transferase-like glycosyltransferase
VTERTFTADTRPVSEISTGALAVREIWIAAGLFLASFTALAATQATVGFVRDESIYFVAAESYAGWLQNLFRDPGQALSDAAIVRFFDINHEHPALMKMLFGLSHLLLHQALGLFKPAASFRIPAFAVASLIPALIFLLGSSLYGRKAGLWAALSFLLVPRQFFNSQLACFDVPIAAFWLLTVYAFYRAQHQPRWWLYCGLAFGLALATKHNGWFLPLVLTPFALWRSWRAADPASNSRLILLRLVGLYLGVALLYAVLLVSYGRNGFVARFVLLSPASALLLILWTGTAVLLVQLRRSCEPAFRAIAPLAAMAALGPLIFYLHWPYLWHHPVDRAAWYFDFHATHVHYAWFYLGKLLREPPFPLAYVGVKTALTVPLSIFLPMILGLGALACRALFSWIPADRRPWPLPSWPEILIAANAIAPILIISHPEVPHFGGVKHWFPAMPFLAIFGGWAVARSSTAAFEWLRQRLPRIRDWQIAAPLFGLLFAAPLYATVRVHPYGTSFYSEPAGGIPGAATLGMQRQFWSNNVTGVLSWLNQNAPPGARVWLHEVTGLAFREYQENGMLRSDLQAANGPADSQIAVYQYHQEFREHEMNIWQAFGTTRPVTGLYLDETPQIVVYQR